DLRRRLQQLPAALDECRTSLSLVHPILLDCLEGASAASNDAYARNTNRYRFPHGIVPMNICEAAAEATQSFGRLVDILTQMSEDISESLDDSSGPVPKVDLEGWFPVIGSWLARAEGNLALWMSYAINDSEQVPHARWVEKIEYNGNV